MFLHLLLLLLPLVCSGEEEGAPEPAGLSSSHIRAVAERSSQLAAQLSSILDRVREERIRQLGNKIERREEERDKDKKVRSQKFRQMLTQFYFGDHYDFSL